jgi:hypothetical protein
MSNRISSVLLGTAADDLEVAARLIRSAARVVKEGPEEQVIPALPEALERFAVNCEQAAKVVREIPA